MTKYILYVREIIFEVKDMVKQHIHTWQFVNFNIEIDSQGNTLKRSANFICECGEMKIVKTKGQIYNGITGEATDNSLKINKTKAQESTETEEQD